MEAAMPLSVSLLAGGLMSGSSYHHVYQIPTHPPTDLLMNDRLEIIQFFSAESFQLSMTPAECRSKGTKFDRPKGRFRCLVSTKTLISST
jgi:ribosomal protein S27E